MERRRSKGSKEGLENNGEQQEAKTPEKSKEPKKVEPKIKEGGNAPLVNGDLL